MVFELQSKSGECWVSVMGSFRIRIRTRILSPGSDTSDRFEVRRGNEIHGATASKKYNGKWARDAEQSVEPEAEEEEEVVWCGVLVGRGWV